MRHLLATDYSGLLEFSMWWLVNGIYAVMLFITALSCLGRRHTRTNDDLTHALLRGGFVLLLSWLWSTWHLLSRNPTDWKSLAFHSGISALLWLAALGLRKWQQRG